MAIKVEYAVQESITNIRRNLFITMAAILVVAASLALLGGALLVRQAVNRTHDIWGRNVRVTIFLADDMSQDQKDELEREIRQMPEVAEVRFESKQQAFENFKRLFANQPELLRNATAEALPESFRIQLKDPEKFTIIRDRFEGRVGLTIRDEKATLERLFSFANRLKTVALYIAGGVLFAAVVLIATTIRMAIYARRKEIGVMKLVGATNWFIRIPFMMEGVIQGAVGALAATAVLAALKPVLFNDLTGSGASGLRVAVNYADIGAIGFVLLAAGIAIGALGSVLGLRRFLEV